MPADHQPAKKRRVLLFSTKQLVSQPADPRNLPPHHHTPHQHSTNFDVADNFLLRGPQGKEEPGVTLQEESHPIVRILFIANIRWTKDSNQLRMAPAMLVQFAKVDNHLVVSLVGRAARNRPATDFAFSSSSSSTSSSSTKAKRSSIAVDPDEEDYAKGKPIHLHTHLDLHPLHRPSVPAITQKYMLKLGITDTTPGQWVPLHQKCHPSGWHLYHEALDRQLSVGFHQSMSCNFCSAGHCTIHPSTLRGTSYFLRYVLICIFCNCVEQWPSIHCATEGCGLACCHECWNRTNLGVTHHGETRQPDERDDDWICQQCRLKNGTFLASFTRLPFQPLLPERRTLNLILILTTCDDEKVALPHTNSQPPPHRYGFKFSFGGW
jgi:hypothetical protein